MVGLRAQITILYLPTYFEVLITNITIGIILEARKKQAFMIFHFQKGEHYWATASVETFKKVQYSTTNMNHECDFYLTGKQ